MRYVSGVIQSKNLTKENAFKIHRNEGSWNGGRFETTETIIPVQGIVTIASPKQIMQYPEGDRQSGMMNFRSPTEMYKTGETNISDTIEWQRSLYKVLQVYPLGDYGFYRAVAVYLSEV